MSDQEKAEEKGRVTYKESGMLLSRRAGEVLQKLFAEAGRPILLADISGNPFSRNAGFLHMFGGVYEPRETGTYCFRIKRSVREFLEGKPPIIGALTFEKTDRWTLAVFGREYAEFFKETAGRLTERFNLHVHVSLSSELPRWPSGSGGS